MTSFCREGLRLYTCTFLTSSLDSPLREKINLAKRRQRRVFYQHLGKCDTCKQAYREFVGGKG